MRLSFDTLFLLAKEGDEFATRVIIWVYADHRDAEVWAMSGHIGAGWPGVNNADQLRA